jgi:hypothetical protein
MAALCTTVGSAAQAQSTGRLLYRGGPVLSSFTIYPLYYGSWSSAELTAQQSYLVGLASYLSGAYDPPGQLPMMWQYGVYSASVASAPPPMAGGVPRSLSIADMRAIIFTAQRRGLLPGFGPNRLLVVFTAHGFTQAPGVCPGDPTKPGLCGYHTDEGQTSIFATVPADTGPTLALVTAHEVFEAAADPAIDITPGWTEAVDGCSTFPGLPFGSIPGAHDNTQNGACSATGFITPPPAPTGCGALLAGQALVAGTGQSTVSSCSGQYTLAMQGDGNLVLYHNGVGPVWASGTSGQVAVTAVMQGDGNLVVNRGFGDYTPDVIWATNTYGQPGSVLRVQDDGNLVVYTSNGVAIWAANQPGAPTSCGTLTANQGLSQGRTLTSCDGRFTLTMQLDGNLVLSELVGLNPPTVQPLWSSGTSGSGNLVEAVMQGDGNLVLYNRLTGAALWASGTAGHPDAVLSLQNDGNLVIYAGGSPVWASNTCCH